MKKFAPKLLLALTCVCAVGCSCGGCIERNADESEVEGELVGRFSGGSLSRAELNRELQRLPPTLREQFGTPEGQRELIRSLIDKKLLVAEAHRRGLAERPEIRTQVRELEERLVVQEMLAEEERLSGRAPEAELRAYYESHKQDFAEPERVRVARILVAVEANAATGKRAQARARAELYRTRLRRGEPVARVATEGEGPESARGGDMGLWAAGQGTDVRLEQAAFALKAVGELSPVVETEEGLSVLSLLERRPPRIPSFEEARAAVEGRVIPARKRQVFEHVLLQLRQKAAVEVIP